MQTRISAWLPLVVALVAACDTPAGGRWPREGVADPDKARPPATVVTAPDLTLRAFVERDTFVVGEPVYLILRLVNTGTAAQRVFGSLDPSDGAVEITISGPEGRAARFAPLVEADHDSSIVVELAAGDSLGAVAPVFFGANGWTFPAPGTYSLTASYRTAGGGQLRETKAAAVNVHVRANGDGAGEFLVGTGAASLEAGKFLAWQSGDHLTAGREHLTNLLTRYPRSDLAHYVRSALAHSYGTRFMNYQTRAVRPPDCQLALEQLRAVSDDRLPGFLRLRNAMTRARCAVRGGDGAGARREIQQARQVAGTAPEYRAILTQLADLERALGGQGRQQQ